MRTVIKIVLSIVALMIYGIIQVVLKGGDVNQTGVGGPIGIILLFGLIAGLVAIWKYKPDKKNNNEIDKKTKVEEQQLNKS